MARELRFEIDPDRPEEEYGSPSEYYSAERAVHYAHSNSMRKMQRKMTARALELIEIDPDAWVLDLGCGTGMGQELLVQAGVHVIGLDVAWEMLVQGRHENWPRVCADMTLLPFREHSFDAVISISAMQWILSEDPNRRDAALVALVKELARALIGRGSLVMQFYPRTDIVLKDVKEAFATTNSFEGQLVIDNPQNPKKRKIYLVVVKNPDPC
jgi:18S rRNA (guanine1575-N7)-methyltransferase